MNVITNNNVQCSMALTALQHVTDPEIGLNVVDLGLIYQLDFDDTDKKIFCTMTLTTQFCPMGESITNAVVNALQTAFRGNEIVMHLTFDPSWNYDMISGEGRIFLNQ